jgi:cysteine desulfurase / selenocysteine lyase
MTINDLIGNAEVFPILNKWDFFQHAGVSPLPRMAGDALRNFATHIENASYLEANWHPQIKELRSMVAKMINATPEEITFVKNTSEGISTCAFGVDWKEGDVVVTTAVEYPANIYPWMEVARRHKVRVVMVKEESDADGRRIVPMGKILDAAADPRTKLIALSHVEYASGQRNDLAAIGAFCRARGILFCVDAIQSMGVVPIDVQSMNIDYLSADGHKWLLSPEAAGVLYVRRDLQDRTRPLSVGATSVIDFLNFGDYNYTLRPDAGRYESGSLNVPGLLAMKASFEMFLSAGMDNVTARIKQLSDYLIAGLQRKGYQIVSPRAGDQWSGIVSFMPKSGDPNAIVKTLREKHRIEIVAREGRLRASAHFYNTEEQMDRLIAALPNE